MMILALMAYAIVGVGAGILAGLLGISGGMITVPCLALLFSLQGLPNTQLMQLAIGTSLASMVFNTLSSMRAHHNLQAIHWKLVKHMLPGLLLGCLIGAFLGHLLPGAILRLIFGLFAIFVGVYFYQDRRFADMRSVQLPRAHTLNSLGFAVGALSNVLGIGGGTMTVPLFVWLKVPLKSAVASSTVTGFIISLFGALSYLAFGLGISNYAMTLGYIYIPAFIVLAITTFIAAPFGARLSHRIHTRKLRKLFATCLIAVGIIMMFR